MNKICKLNLCFVDANFRQWVKTKEYDLLIFFFLHFEYQYQNQCLIWFPILRYWVMKNIIVQHLYLHSENLCFNYNFPRVLLAFMWIICDESWNEFYFLNWKRFFFIRKWGNIRRQTHRLLQMYSSCWLFKNVF